MYKPLFTNIIIISQEKEKVQAFLENSKNILKWDTDISLIEEEYEAVKISRASPSLNDKETLRIESGIDRVVYHVEGNRLDYQVIFELIGDKGVLEIAETLSLPKETNNHLPLKLLKPVTKHAFASKLEKLATIVEQL